MSAFVENLLRPRRIALVGISDDKTKTASRPLQYLRRAQFPGTIYNVNPARPTVQGEPAYQALAELPERPDHAFILTPTERAVDAVEECGRLGIPIATVLASGFAEAGAAGAAHQARLRGIAERTGIRILGPSSMGLVNTRERLTLTANAAFAEPDLKAGGTFVASHSGSLIGALVSRGKVRGIGFHSLVSVGGEVDLSIGAICAATLDDPEITGYLLFLETMRHADALRDFAVAAAARGKPILAYKLGRSQEAAELAVSHTGAMAGEDDVADAFLMECGIARVGTFDGLLEGLPLLQRLPRAAAPGRKPTVGVVTTTGGGAAMAVDQLAVRGVAVAAPSATTLERLATAGVEVVPGRIVDLTLAGTRYKVMKAALDVLLAAPEFDLVLATVGSSARFQPDLAVRPVIDSIGAEKPLAAFIVPEAPEALLRLSEAGVPNFRSPESCADAIAAAFARRPPRARGIAAARLGAAGRVLDEAESYALLAEIGVPVAPFAVIAPDAPISALPFAYPVVAKVLSAEIAHKSDVGGVALDIEDAAALARAARTIVGNVAARRPGTAVARLLVQPMLRGIGEVLVGYRVDPQVGPLVMLAAGGVLAELRHDRALRLAPVDLGTAQEMIGEVTALKVLAGYRGQPAGDLEALARTIVALSGLAARADVVEAEINPLVVHRAGEGVAAVDALVRRGA
jgi:acyl-CoA synthetase (NDP forming)